MSDIASLSGDVRFENFLGVKQAAALLGVSKATLYGWVHSRRIPFRKHGSKLAFCPLELRQWSDRTRQGEIHPYAVPGLSGKKSQSGKNGSLKSREKEWSPTSQPGGS